MSMSWPVERNRMSCWGAMCSTPRGSSSTVRMWSWRSVEVPRPIRGSGNYGSSSGLRAKGHGARHSGQNFCNVTDHGQELVPPFVRQVRVLGPEPRPREDFRHLFKCLFARDEPDPARIRKLQSRECWPRGVEGGLEIDDRIEDGLERLRRHHGACLALRSARTALTSSSSRVSTSSSVMPLCRKLSCRGPTTSASEGSGRSFLSDSTITAERSIFRCCRFSRSE